MKTISCILLLLGILIPHLVEAQGNRSRKDAVLVEQFKIENNKLLTDDYLLSNNFAIGVLRANKWNTGAATRYLKKLLAWRAVNKMDQLGDAPVDPDLLERFPYRVSAATKDGCPVLELDGGKWLVADFVQSYDFVRDAVDALMKYTMQMFEKPRRALTQLAPQCDQAILIVNAKGLTTKSYAEPNVISTSLRLATNMENYYPNLYKKLIIINSNEALAGFLNIVVSSLGQTSSAIRLFSENEEDEAMKLISQYIDPEQLTIY